MITPVPNSFGAARRQQRLREFNQCHAPGGQSSGGQFCSADAAVSPGDAEKFKALKGRWAQVNDALLHLMSDHAPNSPEVTAKCAELKQIVKDCYALKADPGGIEGIGLPGGPRDIVVVGAGPGGMASAIMGGTDGLDTLLIDANPQPGGQAKYSSRIENYPGFPVGVSGADLTQSFSEQAQRVGAEAKFGVRVTGLDYDPATGLKTLTLSNGSKVTARSVVLAGGIEFNKLSFPGSDSPTVIYADGERLQKMGAGKTVVVVGGSNGAAQAALGAARSAKDVYVISRNHIVDGMSDYQVEALTHNQKIHIIEGDEIAALTALGDGGTLRTKQGKTINTAAVGIFIGGKSDTRWLPASIERREGKLAVDSNLETKIPGVFAVGDMRVGGIPRIGAAVGDGQMAERGVFDYFRRVKIKAGVKESLREAKRAVTRDPAAWNRLVDQAFALDEQYPFLVKA